MTTPITPAEIAASLTDAQRQMMREARPYGSFYLMRVAGVGMDTRFHGEQRDRMRKRGLALYWNPHFDCLTAPGLAVRDIIQEQSI